MPKSPSEKQIGSFEKIYAACYGVTPSDFITLCATPLRRPKDAVHSAVGQQTQNLFAS